MGVRTMVACFRAFGSDTSPIVTGGIAIPLSRREGSVCHPRPLVSG